MLVSGHVIWQGVIRVHRNQAENCSMGSLGRRQCLHQCNDEFRGERGDGRRWRSSDRGGDPDLVGLVWLRGSASFVNIELVKARRR